VINTSLTYETLAHSIKVASSKAIIVSKQLYATLGEILPDLVEDIEVFIYDEENMDMPKALDRRTFNLNSELKSISSEPIDISNLSSNDKLFYIYTSGTTGKPKPASKILEYNIY
jgi:solute carrier family 27 (fatty acid transporter), member 1/4